jgi:hypothetical protein
LLETKPPAKSRATRTISRYGLFDGESFTWSHRRVGRRHEAIACGAA